MIDNDAPATSRTHAAAMEPDGILVAARDLTKRFGERVAVDGVSFNIQRGESFGFLGPNGAGKSTVVNMLSTYLAPDAGRVVIDGLPSRDMTFKRKIGVVPQELALYNDLTAQENLSLMARIYDVPAATRRDRIREVLEQVGLLDRANERVEGFSGGMPVRSAGCLWR